MNAVLLPVRCPYCRRLAAEAAPGSVVRVKCVRCHALFEQVVREQQRPAR